MSANAITPHQRTGSAKSFPAVPKPVLDALDELYPERCADPNWTDRKVWIEAGRRDVVRFLKMQFEKQTKAT